jgi:hypothetical protein
VKARPQAEAAGLQGFVQGMQLGCEPIETVEAALVGSQEYFDRL